MNKQRLSKIELEERFKREREELDMAIQNYGWVRLIQELTPLDKACRNYVQGQRAKSNALDRYCPDTACGSKAREIVGTSKRKSPRSHSKNKGGYFALLPHAHLNGAGICFKCQQKFDGWKIIMLSNGITNFKEAVDMVKNHIGFKPDPNYVRVERIERKIEPVGPTQEEISHAKKQRDKMNRIWKEAVDLDNPIAAPVIKYFFKRGITSLTTMLKGQVKYHQAMPYYISVPFITEKSDDEDVKYRDWVVNYCKSQPDFQRFYTDSSDKSQYSTAYMGNHPCILLIVRNNSGQAQRLHRIYLDKDGGKIRFSKDGFPAKLMMSGGYGMGITGCGCHLDPVGCPIEGVAEGFETSLAVKHATNMPMQCLINAGGVLNYQPAMGTKVVFIWEDKDVSETGQNVGRELEERLVPEGYIVFRMSIEDDIPSDATGIDWLDILQMKGVNGFPELARNWESLLQAGVFA